jgi:hypothetical protein
MSDPVPSSARGFQAEDAEHIPAEDTHTEPPSEGFQAEAGEHSPPAPEERGPAIA